MSVILYVWVIAWFPVQFGKNKHESEGRVYLWALKNPRVRVFSKFHEKSSYYLTKRSDFLLLTSPWQAVLYTVSKLSRTDHIPNIPERGAVFEMSEDCTIIYED